MAWLALIYSLHAEIIEINRMEALLPYIDKGSWVLFDIDDTLLESELQVGRPKWFFHELEKQMAQGTDYEAAVLSCYPMWIRIQEICPIKPPESETPLIVRRVQQAAGAVFGLSARHPPISATTLKQLAYIGIDFTFSAPFCPNIETKAPTEWKGGVLFITDFNSKAEVFRKWMEKVQLRPSKIILIDDGKNHLIQMEKQMAEIKIPCICFHYIKTLERPFDPETAEMEYLSLTGEKGPESLGPSER